MITLRHTASALALSTLLVLGACNKKPKTDDVDLSEIKVETTDSKTIKKMLEVDDRKVSESEAEKALSELGLAAKSDDMNWDSKKGASGDYHYKNLSFKADDGEDITIADLKLEGVHMEGDDPTFDRMSVTGFTIKDDDTTGTIESLVLARPNPAMAKKILKSLDKMDSLDDLDIDMKVDGDIGFGAVLLNGMDIKDEDATVKIDTLGWGSDETTGKGAFLAQNININAVDEDLDTPIVISLKSASAKDVSAEIMSKITEGKKGLGGKSFNPMQSGLGNLQLEDFSLTADVLSMTLEGVKSKSTTKGDITTEHQVLQPLKISFSGPSTDKDIGQMQQTLSSLGFETIELTGQSTRIFDKSKDSMTVKDGILSLKEGFDLTYDLEASGVNAAMMNGDKPSMDKLDFSRLNIQFTDQSIVEKGIKFAADMQNTDPALIKMQAKGGLMFLTAMADGPEQTQMLSELSDSVGKMIDYGGTLSISLNPSSPVKLSEVQSISDDPNKGLERLGLSISHKP